ncbi:hypothetical protein LEP1GSC050_4259 [Leptospira broomii serovar Hurstbridge str. 5399]|uniref:Uncharacterized protein n=1 Tax=Leptospira broomii serovar Hurstbridge str. 5399 TaxID=1049789 RepID=T0FCV1_9LEPT|nr:hypothetical protein LEP1GSC050_4259 [Leptospira broomii serovar Hurstbridge str. 5399]
MQVGERGGKPRICGTLTGNSLFQNFFPVRRKCQPGILP